MPADRTPLSDEVGGLPDVRAADLQEELAEQRFSVPSAPTKTAATQRTSQRAERAIEHSAIRSDQDCAALPGRTSEQTRSSVC
jgi:hypothetical protein